jgi:deoxyribonuclease-4
MFCAGRMPGATANPVLPSRVFGSHLSIAGSMVNALLEAESLGMDTVQVFTKNQQQWKVAPLDPGVVRDWHAHVTRLSWQGRTVSHASYLINLASVSDELWAKSVGLMTVEVQRCEELGIPFLVHHPGSFTGSTLDHGLRRIADAYAEIFRRTRGYKTISCLEGTVGAGSLIGGRFEHLAALREMISQATGEPGRIGFCLDTCHMHAAGYDMSTRAAAAAALADFDRTCGIQHLRVLHINDSKGVVGSKLDRHQHIGMGTIGGGLKRPTQARLAASGFAAVVNDPHCRTIPKILETPKEERSRTKPLPAPGTVFKGPKPLDIINLQRLKALMDGDGSGTRPPYPAKPKKHRPSRRVNLTTGG